jgi:hypothetical protein
VKKFEAADWHGFVRIKAKDLSVPIRVDPWPEPISSQLHGGRDARAPRAKLGHYLFRLNHTDGDVESE